MAVSDARCGDDDGGWSRHDGVGSEIGAWQAQSNLLAQLAAPTQQASVCGDAVHAEWLESRAGCRYRADLLSANCRVLPVPCSQLLLLLLLQQEIR